MSVYLHDQLLCVLQLTNSIAVADCFLFTVPSSFVLNLKEFNCFHILLVCCSLFWFRFLCLLPADSAAAGLFAYWKQCHALKFHLCVVLHGLICLLCTLILFLFEQLLMPLLCVCLL